MQNRVRHLPLTALATALAASLLAVVPGFERTTFAEMRPAIERSAETAAGQANVKVFDEVWSRVRDSFYDPKFGGLNWEAIGNRYRPQVAEPGADVGRVINRMLAELGASHTGYYTPADIAYYDLADIFSGGLRRGPTEAFCQRRSSLYGNRHVDPRYRGQAFRQWRARRLSRGLSEAHCRRRANRG